MKRPADLPIPLVDLTAQYRAIKPEIDAAVQRVLDRGRFILGPEVEALEQDFAAYCGAAYAVGVASGTDALELALRASGIGPGDEVITTAFSFFATAQAIVSVGAIPVFVDIDPETYTINPALIERAISPRTRAILPVHLYGQPCQMEAILALAAAHDLQVIEDCAQAVGATAQQRRVGSFGLAGCFSFYPTKNLGAYGDGGMVVTHDARLAEQIRVLRVHGSRDRIEYEAASRNSRLDELQAAILRAKLPHLDDWNAARRQHAAAYHQLLERERLPELRLPQERPGCEHVFHLYAIGCPQRDAVLEALRAREIGAHVHYPRILPSHRVLTGARSRAGEYPVAERLAAEVISLPLYPELTEEMIETVVRALASTDLVRPAPARPAHPPVR